MALTFFKTPKNKQFSYKPVYYDKKKEEREKRLQSAFEAEHGVNEAVLRERMRLRWKRTAGTREQKASRQRLWIIIAIIASLAYLVFFR